MHEIGSLSGCRMERLVNHGMSGLPAFLTLEGGLNSGFMIAQVTAAALGTRELPQLYECMIVVCILRSFGKQGLVPSIVSG